jgi:hypothetical protein
MPHGVLWPLDTTLVVFVVEDVSARLSWSLEGISTLIETSALSLAHLVPTLLVCTGGGKSIYMYPSLLPSFGY